MTLLPEFRAQLHTAAHRRAHRRRNRVFRRLSPDGRVTRAATGIPILLSVLITVGIAAVALVTLSHRSSTPAPATRTTAPVTTRADLVKILGVLRRPSTQADRLATRIRSQGGALPGIFRVSSTPTCQDTNRSLPPCTVKLDPSLVRTVSFGAGYRATIFPATITRTTRLARRGEGILISLRGPGIYLDDSQPTSLQTLRTRGLLLSDYVNTGTDRGAILVPDGVATVTLNHIGLLAPRAADLGQIPPTTSTVGENIAPLQITGLTEQNLHLNPHALGRYFHQGSGHGCRTTFAVYALPATAQMSWLNAAGNTIRRTTINIELYVGTHHPAPGTTDLGPGCPR